MSRYDRTPGSGSDRTNLYDEITGKIIAELEGGPRGAYTGAIGWLGRDGDLDLNILIRTMELQGSEAHCRAGAGIVTDSIAERELAETRHKARGLPPSGCPSPRPAAAGSATR